MLNLKNITAHPSSTIGGVLVAALQAAIMGAAASYAQTGNTTNWSQYALAGGAAAIPVIVGGLYAPAAPVATAPDPKAAIMAQVDAALQKAAQDAMVAEAQKLTGVQVQAVLPQG